MERPGRRPPQKAVAAEVRAAPAMSADILVERRTLHVTFAIPWLVPRGADIQVKKNYLRLKSKADPARADYLLTLPYQVVPGQFVLRETNGVWDFTLTREAPPTP